VEPAVLDLAIALPAARTARPARRGPAIGTAAVLLAPSIVLFLAFTYWPVAQVVWRSLLVQRFGGGAAWGIGNYARLFADPHFARACLNNLLYALGTIIPSIGLALLFALALRAETRLVAVLRTLLVLPLLIPLVAAAALFSFILLPGDGLLDHYLAKLGVSATNWLGDPDLALGAVISITVWKNTGYYMLFFLAGLAGMPRDLIDAAMIDGAGAFTRFRHIILPMLGPTFGFVVPIALVNALVQVDLLHLPAGRAEFRSGACKRGDRGERRRAARAVAAVAPGDRAQDAL
jgi:sn-glycerol 3-phosphate transport system permease protein